MWLCTLASTHLNISSLVVRSRLTPGQLKHLQEDDPTYFRNPRPGQYEWKVNNIHMAQDSPHMMAIHFDSHEERNGLLRGELLSLLAIMTDRLKYPDIEPHLIVPVNWHNELDSLNFTTDTKTRFSFCPSELRMLASS
jgi:hypothetical protein